MLIEREAHEVPVVDADLADPVLDVRQVAALLDVATATVVAYTRRRRAALPVADVVADGLRFYRSEVEAWRFEEV